MVIARHYLTSWLEKKKEEEEEEEEEEEVSRRILLARVAQTSGRSWAVGGLRSPSHAQALDNIAVLLSITALDCSDRGS